MGTLYHFIILMRVLSTVSCTKGSVVNSDGACIARCLPVFAADRWCLTCNMIGRLAKIDLNEEENKPIGKKYGVRGYPTIKIFRQGSPGDYGGPRDARGMVEYLKAARTVRSETGDVCSMVCFVSWYEMYIHVGLDGLCHAPLSIGVLK